MSLDAERFTAENVHPFFFEGERHEVALREAGETLVLEGDEGQRLTALYLNRDFEGQLAIVRLGGMFEDVDSTDMRYTAYQLAVANPENPVMLINIPAHGGSDGLTREQQRQIVDTRGVALVAGSQAIAASSRLGRTQEIVTIGQSAGARLAPDFTRAAHELNLESRALVGFGMAGLDNRPSLSTAIAFLFDGYFAQGHYHRKPADHELDTGLALFEAEMSQTDVPSGQPNNLANTIGVFLRSPAYSGFVVMDSPLSNDSGFEAIEAAMEVSPKMLAAFVSGGLDKVTRWNRIESRVEELVASYRGRLSWDVWPDDGHSMGIASQQPRFAAAVRSVVESLEG